MNNKMIKLDGEGYKIVATPEAEKLKLRLLKSAGTIKKVEDKGDEGIAIATASELASFRKQLEATRKDVKQPVIDLGRKIDSLAERFGLEVKQEEDRIRGLLGGFQTRLAEERRKIEQEAERKRQEALRLEAGAEAARLKAEKTKSTMQEVKAERMEEKALDTRIESMELRQQAENTKVRGGRMELDFTVEDVALFYAEHPELCTITVKTRETKEYLKARAEREKIECPQEHGLNVFLKPVISIR